jgi:DNA replication protein DnaC
MGYCDKHGIEFPEEKTVICGKEFSFSGCQKCYEEQLAWEAKKEKAQEEESRLRYFESCNIEPMYYDSTLDTFIAESDEQKKALAYAREMVETKEGKLVLLGSNGTGKTHLAVGVVRELSGRLYSMYEITTRIRASYVSGAKETELDIVDELARVEMLAIDEIGRTKGSEAETNWLSYIIDKRHTRNLPLMLISNKHTRKSCPSGGCEKCLENYISEDVMSRLSEDGHLVTMTGQDYRRTKRADKRYEGGER